jgi:quinol monooxygenase YgiN
MAAMEQPKFPPGWDEQRVRRVLEHYESQTEEEAVAEDEAGVAQDPTNSDAIWITEVWDSQASHKASLSVPSVKDAISRGKPLIAGFDKPIETVPVGGYGLHAAA